METNRPTPTATENAMTHRTYTVEIETFSAVGGVSTAKIECASLAVARHTARAHMAGGPRRSATIYRADGTMLDQLMPA